MSATSKALAPDRMNVSAAATRRMACCPVVGVLVLALLAGCKSGPFGSGRADGAKSGAAFASKSDDAADAKALDANDIGTGSALDQRLVKIDAAVREWDAAQGEGREAEANKLAATLRRVVDSDFAFFEAASKGANGLRAQNLAVQALAFSGNPAATKLLASRLGDLESSIVGNALIGLKIRSDPDTPLGPIIALIRGNYAEARRYAPLALAHVVRAREAAGRPIDPTLSDEAMAGLVPLIQDGDPYARLHTAKAMGALHRPDAVDFLSMLLKDVRPTIRIAAAAALEKIGDPRSFPDVVALLDTVPDEQKTLVRDILASYAGRLQGRPMTAPEVIQLGISPRAWDRWFVARNIGVAPSNSPAAAPPPGATLPPLAPLPPAPPPTAKSGG